MGLRTRTSTRFSKWSEFRSTRRPLIICERSGSADLKSVQTASWLIVQASKTERAERVADETHDHAHVDRVGPDHLQQDGFVYAGATTTLADPTAGEVP
jgi:hypothetical protein